MSGTEQVHHGFVYKINKIIYKFHFKGHMLGVPVRFHYDKVGFYFYPAFKETKKNIFHFLRHDE